MNISILGQDSQSITVGCKCAYLMNSSNSLMMEFENDNVARSSEALLRKMNLKTMHSDCEISVLNISDYNLTFK